MNTTKRNRGRPKGSGIDDTVALDAVADILLKNPEMRSTTAMKRLLPPPGETVIRRLQGKWKDSKEVFMARAKARHESEREIGRSQAGSGSGGGFGGGMAELDRQMRLLENMERGLRFSEEIERQVRLADRMSSLFERHQRQLTDYENSPAMKALRAIEEHPAMKLQRQLDENPALKAIRQWEMMQKRLGL